MEQLEKEGIATFHFKLFSQFDNISHFVSTRQGGISNGHFSSLNIGFHVGDDNFRVLQNRRFLSEAIGIDLMKFTFANQCHSANVAIVSDAQRGKGAMEKDSALGNFDGMVSNVKNICLAVQVADCVPILLYDPVQKVIGSLHAGWRGTLKKIVMEAVSKMIQNYGSRADDIYAGLGPANGPCCYEVGEDVYREARISLGLVKDVIKPAKNEGKYIFDQWTANVKQLTDAGLKREHIEVSEICTQCHADTFFSSRANNGVTGRFMAGIMLKKRAHR